MDRKTLLSSLFAATVVAGAMCKTAADSDLRGLFVRTFGPAPERYVPTPPLPRPNDWPLGLDLVLGATTHEPAEAWALVECDSDSEFPSLGEVEFAFVSATLRPDGGLTIQLRHGNLCRTLLFSLDAPPPSAGDETKLAATAWELSDLPFSVTNKGARFDRPLSNVVGRVSIDSRASAQGQRLAIEFALGCEGDSGEWFWSRGGGTAVIQPSK
jgi:hypothetical protein